jgi:outer membrane protease
MTVTRLLSYAVVCNVPLVLPLNFSALFAIDFTFETSVAIKNAITSEYVYEGERCVSRLDWIDNGIPIFSFTGQSEVFNVVIRTKIDMAIPAKSGVGVSYINRK